MKTLMITGGSIQKDFALSFIKKLQPEYILAVDKGLQFCYEQKIIPNYIVGDFDSLAEKIFTFYKQQAKIPIREYNPVKDATDTCIGLEKAIEVGSSSIWILGATGTRVDHMLCNLQILKKSWIEKIPTYLVDAYNLITLPVQQEFFLEKDKQFGTYVSFFPLGDQVDKLTLEGFKYPLKEYCLKNLEGLGVSNEILENRARVHWEGGNLVMIQSRD